MRLSPPRRPAAALVAGVASLTLLTGCGIFGPSGGSGDADQGSGGSNASDENTGSSGGGSVRVDGVDADDVIISESFPLVSNPDDSTTIGVQSLTVEGKTMILRLIVTPEFASVSRSDEIRLYDAFDREYEPVLIDRENLKRYSVIRDGGQDFAAPYTRETVNGTPTTAWFAFAAPEDDIETIDLQVQPDWPEILDIPITR